MNGAPPDLHCVVLPSLHKARKGYCPALAATPTSEEPNNSQGFQVIAPVLQGRSCHLDPTRKETHEPNESPPTPGWLHKTSRLPTDFRDCLKKFIRFILRTLDCVIIVGLRSTIPISMIVVGSVNLNDCPAEPYIPTYLIVGGVFGVVKVVCHFLAQRNVKEEEEQELPQRRSPLRLRKSPPPLRKSRPLDRFLNYFLFTWFIAGCIWIYSMRKPEYGDLSSPTYCDESLYLFCFWLATSCCTMLGLLIVLYYFLAN